MDEKKIISTTLRFGVIIASALVISGLILFIVFENNMNIYSLNTSNINLTNFKDPSTITLYGIIALISIPFLIVLEQVIIYLVEKDKIYIVISVTVLLLMLFAVLVMPKLLFHS